MISPTTAATISPCAAWGGFQLYRLHNAGLEVVLAPELGAKVVSLKNLRTGREWMCSPTPRLKLFRNQLGDDFSTSTLAGWDECLPTIAPCIWKGQVLADHGEAWSSRWDLDASAMNRGVLQTTLRLPVSPLSFTRALELHDNTLLVAYTLQNLSSEEQKYLWAAHPLLSICEGDRLELTEEMRKHLNGAPWIDSLQFGSRVPACAKVYAGPLREGRAGVFNPGTGDRLTWEWDTAECDTLGLWLTRGGWNGHHHLALEVTNSATDFLTEAADRGRCGIIAPGGKKSWNVRVRIEP